MFSLRAETVSFFVVTLIYSDIKLFFNVSKKINKHIIFKTVTFKIDNTIKIRRVHHFNIN